MRKFWTTAGLAAVAATAGLAVSQPAAAQNGCERSKHDDRVTGTVLGGVVGAIAGSAIGHDATGALVGAGVGAVGGNVIAGRRAGPCPDYRGYNNDRRSYRSDRYTRSGQYRDNGYRRSAYDSGRCGWQDQAYRDAYGNVVHRQVQVCR